MMLFETGRQSCNTGIVGPTKLFFSCRLPDLRQVLRLRLRQDRLADPAKDRSRSTEKGKPLGKCRKEKPENCQRKFRFLHLTPQTKSISDLDSFECLFELVLS